LQQYFQIVRQLACLFRVVGYFSFGHTEQWSRAITTYFHIALPRFNQEQVRIVVGSKRLGSENNRERGKKNKQVFFIDFLATVSAVIRGWRIPNA